MFEEKIAEVLSNIKETKEAALSSQEIISKLEKPPQTEMGDFAFPCFFLAGKLKKNPSVIAEDIAKRIKLPKEIESVKAINGYVNFFINKSVLAEKIVREILKQEGDYGKSKEGKGKRIVIDFSGPNIGKPMHIGHIRSTILGDSLLRILDFQGYSVKGINYLGDIGLHIGKLIVAYELWLDKEALKKDPVKELLRLYIKFCDKEKTEYNEDFEEELQDNEWTNKAKEKLRLLELGNKKTIEIWHEIIRVSKEGFNEIYKILNVSFHETTGQSLFSERGKQIIAQALKEGKAKLESDGAVYAEFKDLPKKYVLRSNGTASYITQDIGAAVERYRKYKFDRMIYVTDFRQEMHFRQLFALLREWGYDFSGKLIHIGFGTINFEGEILATRKGKIILLNDVLEKTIVKAKEEIKKRKTKGNAADIGVGAIKYAILKNAPAKDVNFSWEQALKFEGDSGPYLQYSHARACSILRKRDIDKVNPKADFSVLNNPREQALIKILSEFPDACENASEQFSPNILANYTYDLSKTFNDFYEACPVLKAEKEKEARLLLVAAARQVLKNALNLLGIEAIEEM